MANIIKFKKALKEVSLEGVSFISEENPMFSFAPDDPVPGRVASFHGRGYAQQMTDGTFEFIRKPKKHSQAVSIKKLAHGRASHTKDQAVLLTIKVFIAEHLDISQTIQEEANAAVEAIRNYQL